MVAVSLALIATGASGYVQQADAAAGGALAEGVTARIASTLAAETGEPVEVVAERSEYTRTMANPDGTYTLTQSVTPQRARAEDGSWRSIDVTLEKRADGTIGPKVAVVDVSFSGGGSGADLIRLASPRGALELGWPKALPSPTLSGATATYPEVYKGVDLQLTATPEGFREVLVVKSAEAAANPELNRISLSARGEGLDIVPGAGGGLRALDGDGNAVFSGPAGMMWDSSGDSGGAGDGVQPQLMPAAEGPESAEGAADPAQPDAGDATAVLPVQVSDGSVTVVPDLGLLRGKDTVFPVYIDPPIGTGASEKSVISSDGDRWWNFDGDYGVGRCYRVGPWYCDADHTNRMLFEFAPTKLTGMHVLDATFRAYETWSFSCTPHEIELVRTNNMSEATRWPGPAELDHMGDQNVSAGRGEHCSPEQPDKWIEFHDNPAETDENLTATVRNFANGSFSRLTLMLKAKDESDPDAWKRFEDNADLQVIYVPKPHLPNNVGVIPGLGKQQYCARDVSDPTIVTFEKPRIQGMVQTQQQPQGNEFRGSLRALFHTQYLKSDGTWADAFKTNVPSTGSDPDDTLERYEIDGVADGVTYRFNVLTESYWTWNGQNGKLSSGRSAWCYFKVDTSAPKAPAIRSNLIDGKGYTECTATLCEGHGGPGEPGSFTFTPNIADKDITGYRWRLMTTAVTRAKTVSGATATVPDVIPSLAGTHVLTVEAIDVRQRTGTPAEFVFKVAPGSAETSRWSFAETTGSTAADTGTEGTVRHDATLRQPQGTTTVTWSPLGRRGDEDHSIALNTAVMDPALQRGYADTNTPAVNAKDSFTVSAWAYLTDTIANRAVLSAPGEHDSAFTLMYSATKKTWVFKRGTRDTADALDVVTAATQPATARVWTHLAGVFDSKNDTDPKNDTIQLFVNGRPQGEPVVASSQSAAYTAWTPTNGLQFGRTKTKSADKTFSQYYRGNIDEVAVWHRALTAEELRSEAKGVQPVDDQPSTALVAHWNAVGATGTSLPNQSAYPVGGLALSASGASLPGEDNGLVLNGSAGYVTGTGPVVDELGSFTVSATVKLNDAVLASKATGYRAYVFGQAATTPGESSWALWAEKDDTGYRWKFGRTVIDAAGKPVTKFVSSLGLAVTDTWVQVTGVYDAAESPDGGVTSGNTQLYVNLERQPHREDSALDAPGQGSGALSAGRGSANGTTGHYLPGSLQSLRVWVGAMSEYQVFTKVLGA
ncbi:LamG domain-containing protein [Streptomyces sp. NRRL S-118]|uniref:LamG domain-containing protein n=1 Tax=Streptomyces sp. NRRL S-118 TaxID=1463881 RepID=UPI00099D3FD3|nr:LamG domain-containing protein [Streptomyces sp. NRRL S-118]